MGLLLAATVALAGLILAPGQLFYFDVTPKLAVLLVGTAAALFGARRAPRWFTILALLSILSLTISSAVSTNEALSFFGTNWRRFGAVAQAAVLVFALLVAGHADRHRTILRAIAIATGIMAIYGIAQYFGRDPILPAASYHIGEGIWTIVRPPGTLGYVSYFATWLVVAVFLSLALRAVETNKVWRVLATGTAVLAIVAMFFTGTRAALLGLAAGVLVLLWFRVFRITRRMAAAAGAVVLAGVAFFASPLGWPLRSRTRWFMEDPWGGARIALWHDSLRMGLNRPPFGYGPEVFGANFPHWESKELARAYPDFAHESPHNIFLDALIAQGIVGPLLLAAFCLGGFLAARRTRNPWLAAAIAAGIVSQQFTVFTMPTAMIFFTTLALAVGLGGTPGPLLSRRWLLAPVAAGFVYCALRLVAADHALALAKRSLDSGDLAAGAQYYQRYTHLRFPGTSADLWYSRALMDLARATPEPATHLQALLRAGEEAAQATHTSEEPFSAWYSLAAIYGSRNDAARTESSLRAAIDTHPNWFKPHWMLAQLLRMQSRLPEAEKEAALGVDLNGGKNPEVAQTLAEIRTQRNGELQK